MKYVVELDYEMVDKIIIQELQSNYADMKRDLANRVEGSLAIWEHDVEEDKKAIKKHMKALKRILKYYGAEAE
jgi:gas vesicle protein